MNEFVAFGHLGEYLGGASERRITDAAKAIETVEPFIDRMQPVTTPDGVRVDTHMAEGAAIPPHYDSLIAKVIAHADTREAAIETMLAALGSARIEGVSTTIPLHVAVLSSDAFRSGDYDTRAIPGYEATAEVGG